MEFEIYSHEGVGQVRFGMSPNTVRSVLGGEFESFKRTPQSTHPCDFFPKLQCFVYYDTDGEAEAVELSQPAEPMLNGVKLLGLSFSELVKQVKKVDPKVLVESDGFTSVQLGIGAYAPSAESEPEATPESIFVFARGYYE